MPEHEPWCCRSPESECAKAGGCSGSCNCGAGEPERETCREVALPAGGTVRVRSGREPTGDALAALDEIVAATRRLAAQNPPEPGSEALYARIEAARGELSWHGVARTAGVKLSVLFRIGQGRMPGESDLAAIEAWLAMVEA